jgi:hypothetical protein
MGEFKNFLEMVGISAARTIRKNWRGSYKPGTFGIEIEYRVNDGDDDDEHEIDTEYAREVYERQVDRPPEPREWKNDNPEPDKPDRDDYEWSDDYMTNYSNYYKTFGMKEVGPFPLENVHLNIIQDNWIRDQYSILIRSLQILWDQGVDSNDPYKRSMFNNEEAFEKFYRNKRIHYSYQSSHEMEKRMTMARNMQWPDRFQFPEEVVKLIDHIVNEAFKILDKFMEYHSNKAKAIDKEKFIEDMDERYEEDMDDWKTEYNDWKIEYEDALEKWNDWDDDAEFDRWLERNEDRFRNYDRHEDNVDDDIEETDRWFRKQGLKTANEKGGEDFDAWNIFEDEDGVVEISSPILTTADFGTLKKVFDYIRDERKTLDSGTGLHVHIGMPKTSDIFDTLAIAYLTDEDAILEVAGRTERALSSYANKKKTLFTELFEILKDGTYTPGSFEEAIKDVSRYQGVNFFRAFKEIGTVEFRYLTSQVLKNQDKLLQLINYMLMLPRIAHGRSQIRYDVPFKGTIIFSRRPGGKIEVKKFPLNQARSVAQSPEPVNQLRQPELPLKDRLISKFKPQQLQQPTS